MSLPLFPAARAEVFVLLQLPASVSRIDMVFATVLAFAMVLGLIAVFVLGIIALGTILSVPMFMVPFVGPGCGWFHWYRCDSFGGLEQFVLFYLPAGVLGTLPSSWQSL